MKQKGYSKELKSEVVLAAVKAQQAAPSGLRNIALRRILPLLFRPVVLTIKNNFSPTYRYMTVKNRAGNGERRDTQPLNITPYSLNCLFVAELQIKGENSFLFHVR
jgi:hypothetical protein